MNIYRRMQSLWGKITVRGNQESTQPDHFQNPAASMPTYRYGAVQHHPTAYEKQHRATEQYYWQKQLRLAKELNVLTKWLNWITGIGAVVALLGLVFLWRTLEATELAAVAAKDAVTVARDTLNSTVQNSRLDQRAWVGVKQINLAKLPTANEQVVAVTELSNTGKTPGLNVTNRITFTPDAPKSLKSLDALAPKQVGSRVVPPGGYAYPTTNVIPKSRVLTEQEVSDIKAQKIFLYVYGTVTYEDIFAEQHLTRLCAFYVYEEKAPYPTAFRWCPEKDYNYME